MGQALRNKFNGNKKEVSGYAYNFGIWEAMQEYDVSSYDAMCKFLVWASGDPNFVNKCVANSMAGKDIYSKIVDELIRRYFNDKVENEQMAQRIGILEKKIELADRDNHKKALALLRTMNNRPALQECEI